MVVRTERLRVLGREGDLVAVLNIEDPSVAVVWCYDIEFWCYCCDVLLQKTIILEKCRQTRCDCFGGVGVLS